MATVLATPDQHVGANSQCSSGAPEEFAVHEESAEDAAPAELENTGGRTYRSMPNPCH